LASSNTFSQIVHHGLRATSGCAKHGSQAAYFVTTFMHNVRYAWNAATRGMEM